MVLYGKNNEDTKETNHGFVLYVDHQLHPAPLSECFHATASRCLSSRIVRFPVSSIQSVDSLYCPNCLEYFDAGTGAKLGYCKYCQRCPVCLSAVSVQTTTKGDVVWECGLCDWTSHSCGLVASSSDSLEMGRGELLKLVEAKRLELQQPVLDWHNQATDSWNRYDLQQRRSHPTPHTTEWSMDQLMEKLEEKQKQPPTDLPFSLRRRTIQELLIEGVQVTPDDDPSIDNLSIRVCQQQQLFSSRALPLPFPLQCRKSRRCTLELQNGRPGILLKPKLNPLEGDSSLPTGHGQWYRKDSSAIHMVPRVTIVNSTSTSFLLQVSNPTFGSIRLRLKQSLYAGEADHWETNRAGFLPDLLLDTLSQSRCNVQVFPLSDVAPSETVELQSAEDALVEMGIQPRMVPTEVKNWQPDENSDALSSIRVVAKQSSRAWFEIRLPHTTLNDRAATALPIAMEIELGNGSWESSLITPQGDNDMVSFDLLLVRTQ